MKIILAICSLALAAGLASAQCPCSTDGGTLSCQPGIINQFPEDIFKVMATFFHNQVLAYMYKAMWQLIPSYYEKAKMVEMAPR